MNAADVLNQAADLIETDGWAQGDYLNEDGCHCAVGAICEISTGEPSKIEELTLDAGAALASFLDPEWNAGAISPMRFHTIVVDWNDAKNRTQQEVVHGLRAAAQKVSG